MRAELRDAIARLLFYGLHSSRNEEAADAILALPEMQAILRVVDLARVFDSLPSSAYSITVSTTRDALHAAITDISKGSQ